jgi:hypothetical protein
MIPADLPEPVREPETAAGASGQAGPTRYRLGYPLEIEEKLLDAVRTGRQ